MELKSFETERLWLRPTNEEDADLIYVLFNTPKWLKYIGDRNITSRDAAAEYIAEKIAPQWAKNGFGNYTVIRKADGSKMGSCGLYDREGLDGIDLGFAFLPAFESKGYAFEASNRLIDAAFREFELDFLLAITTPDNLASQKLLEKLRFENIGTTQLADDEESLSLYKLVNTLR